MPVPGQIYAPPNVYTQTNFDTPTQAPISGVKLPVLIGTGNEELVNEDFENVRGSSASVDQRIVGEDETGRAVVSINPSTGQITLGDFDGVRRAIQVRNFPIVTGDGSGTTTNNPAHVVVQINLAPIVVLNVDGARGLVELSVAPKLGDDVRVTYFFNRTDTQITDDLSDQVTTTSALVQAEISQPTGGYVLTVDNNEFIVTIDGTEYTVNLGTGSKDASTVATLINTGATGSSLVASIFTNNFGGTALQLVADLDIEIGNGSANSTLGFTNGTATSRNKVFFTFQGPIVDGSNGGVTTTDPSAVVVRVDNVQVVPDAVDGQNRAVTLPYAPAAGSTVTIQYYFNTWQDTFDYLENINVTEIIRCGIIPGDSTFTDGVDFILKDDRIVWGTSFLVRPGEHTDGSTFFDDTQITMSLVDVKAFMEVATAVVDTSVNPPVESRTEFDLPFIPTTGNGRNTPLSQDVFNKITNGRIDLQTFRPDLITAFWGFSIEDAQNRGSVEVVKVDGTTITLKESVPVGATVYASFYYNTIQDETYTATSVVTGGSGVGQYSLTDENENQVFVPQFGAKSAGLGTIQIQFPSGSELKPDCRFEGGAQLLETVTVTFDETDATLAKFTVKGSDPYYTIQDASDHARLTIDSTTLASGAAGIDVSRVNGVDGLGFPASFLGDEVVYDDTTGLLTYSISSGINDEVAVTIDGVLFTSTAAANATATVGDYVSALNTAARFTTANGPEYDGATRFLGDTVIIATEYDKINLSYTGDVTGPSGTLTATITPTTYTSPSLLASAVEAAITAATAAITGLSITVAANAEGQLQFKLEKAADADEFTQAGGSITVTGAPLPAPGDIIFIGGVPLTAVGVPRTPGADDFDVSSGVPGTIAIDIDAAINDPLNSFTSLVTSIVAGPLITLTAVPPGTQGNSITLTTSNPPAFTLSAPTLLGGLDHAGGYLEFLDGPSAAEDFAVLAGISTAASPGGAQVKLLQTDIARRFTVAGASGRLIYDRAVLRGRLVPGGGSMAPYASEEQAGITIEGSNGAEQAGLPAAATAPAGTRAVVTPANLLGQIPVSGNQVPTGTYGDERDGQTFITFFADGGTQPQNNIFRFTIDNTAATVTFTDATGTAIPVGGSADVPVGPITNANTVLGQISAAITAAGITGASVLQEGSGIRLISGSSNSDSVVTIGDGNANTELGFSQGSTSNRTPVEAGVLASVLMADHSSTLSAFYLGYSSPSATRFAGLALAGVIRDETNAEFLYLQSQAATVGGLGTSSNITWVAPSSGNGSVLLPGTGLLNVAGDGASGEDGISGFYVTSTDPDGSGSANTSDLNSGVGQDGNINQTYRDDVTGLTFTVLERAGGGNYPAGESFTFIVRDNVLTDANLPVNAIPGTELTISNTIGVPAGDTALIETYDKSGSEPAMGDVYYTSYRFQKIDFATQFFTRTNAAEREYGPATPENPLSLGISLAKQNGALIVGAKQVLKEPNSGQASAESYAEAIQELEGFLPGGVSLDIITALSIGLTFTELKNLMVLAGQSADIQSSIRNRAERTIVNGMGAGMQGFEAQELAQTVQRTRVRILFPSVALITLTDLVGNESQTFVDGYFISAGFVGVLTSTDVDVATPWTRRRIIGFDRLGQDLSEVEKNQIAVTGITIVNEKPSFLVIRQGLTTNMTDVLTRTPTVITIADQVQQNTRLALDKYIGIKFLSGILIQVEASQTKVLKDLVDAEILTAYAGVRAQSSPSDPTAADVEAFYRPVFPLLYLIATFGLRSTSV